MRIRCPACFADFSLEAALQGDAARKALVWAFSLPSPLAQALTNYLGMFRSEGRVLSWSRVEKILDELHDQIDGEIVTRSGVTRPAPMAVWQQALEQMIELRNTRRLTLPLKSNGYLLEIVTSLVERSAAKAEDEREQQLRQGQRRDANTEVAAKNGVARSNAINQVAADLALGLIDDDEAVEQLVGVGMSREAAKAQVEQHRRDQS